MKMLRCLTSAMVFTFCLLANAQAAPETFRNPILPGYHPDPSIVRVGDDYYMVNSTFEWFPGMPIHHSKDLVNWELIGHGLHRPEQLELQQGLGDYMGIFAVTIRHHDDLLAFLSGDRVGTVARARVLRGGQVQELEVLVGELHTQAQVLTTKEGVAARRCHADRARFLALALARANVVQESL